MITYNTLKDIIIHIPYKIDNTIPIGFFSIGHHKNVDIPNKITESIYDLSPSLSEYERDPKRFDSLDALTHYPIIKPKVDALDNELDEYYHSRIDKQAKSDYFSDYTYNSRDLNKFLIDHHLKNTTPKEIENYSNYVRIMDKTMNAYIKPAPKDFHVYTGVGPNLDILSHRNNRSNRLYLPAFTSTSLHPITATSFSSKFSESLPEPKKYREVVRFHIPQNSKYGTYLGSTGFSSSLGHEHEFLVHRGYIIQFIGEPRMSVVVKPTLVHDAKIIRQIRKPI